MRKLKFVTIALVLLFAGFGGAEVRGAELEGWLGKDNLSMGAISIHYDVKPKIKTKLLIENGKNKYTYNLTYGAKEETFPLQMGNGDYTISLLEQIKGTTYRLVHKDTVKLSLQDETPVYLNSTQNVNWDIDGLAVKKAAELTKDAATDEDKVKAIYNYMISNIKYDDSLAFTASSDYLPDIERTLTVKKDICYGFSSLFAGMLRSVGVPAKLAMGSSDYVKTYHAWNEVFVNGRWVVIDTTADAGWKGTTTAFTMIKDASKYKADKYY
ncbi:transglutaminase-like domain-containing protein [Paenibacillus sp. TH7-28]